ncbi:MAG TPA: diguanylate cyclase [Geodermatophilus sp.]|nr:diguanylate cyclase [Geodermatophilus sp.]
MTSPVSPRRAVRSVYQPIVDLRDRSLVAVEALARGGPGSADSAEGLFAPARASGAVDELDEACLRAALRGLGDVTQDVTVFVNIEPATLSTLGTRRLAELADLAAPNVQVVLEVTERDLLEWAAELVRGVRGARDVGWRVALDDVGAEPLGLALMPFLRPDVIKLDLALVRGHTSLREAAVVNAVRAEAERSGAVLIAEGIETDLHLERALAMGAQLGQGWMFGRPGPLAVEGMSALRLPRPTPRPRAGGRAPALTPFGVLSAGTPPQRATVPLVASMTRQLERQALLLDEQTVVLANVQSLEAMTPRTRRRYESLAAVSALTAVTGVGMPPHPVPGVLGTSLAPGDPLADEWVLTVVGPHFAAALAARNVAAGGGAPEVVDGPAGTARRVDYVLTYDRQRVLDAAGLLLDRVRPSSARTGPAGTTVATAVPDTLQTTVPDTGRGAVPRTAGVPAADLPHLLHRAIATASSGIVIADAQLPDLPVVYANAAFLQMTGYAEDEVLGRNCRFLQGPGTDPSQIQPLRRRMLAGRDVHIVVLNYRRDGSRFWNDVRISPVVDAGGEITHYIGSQLDVTDRVDRERRATYLARHDPLTGLPNRAHVLEHLDLELRRARRGGTGVAAVMLDLNGFKAVNDRLGHAAGDSALVWAARRLRSAVRSGDLLGRLGGDEFLVVLAGLPSPTAPAHGPGDPSADETVHRVQQHLHDALASPLELAGTTVRLSASSGAALFPRDAGDPAALIARADAAMYLDKPAS